MTRTALSKPRIQYGALPFRLAEGSLEVLLATSRETKRWVIPKGWPMKGKAPHKAAEREAFEEAGLKGKIQQRAIGSYRYEKKLKNGVFVECEVEVFPMKVSEQRRRWPEFEQRETRWFAPADAAASVQEPELAELIGKLQAELHARTGSGRKAA
jgi:8-oxo-dGTP pyrophosphatase MutT (NUDIX family)